MEGVVEIAARADSSGRITDPVVQKPVNPLLDAAALHAAREWRFSGQASGLVLTFEFVLWGPGAPADLPPPMFLAPATVKVYAMMTPTDPI